MDGVYLMAAVSINIKYTEFEKKLNAALSRVNRGSYEAIKHACETIKEMSLKQVPRDTNTLANSFFYEIAGSQINSRLQEEYSAIIGYGGNNDPINPKTDRRASEYMIVVHEDLSAYHPIGKAKFLEDPVRAYAEEFLKDAGVIIRKNLR